MRTQACANGTHCKQENTRWYSRRRSAILTILGSVVGHRAQAAPALRGTLQDQIDQCQSGDILTVNGSYEEQIVVSKAVTLYARPEEPASVQWQTTKPYQSTITVVPGGQLRLENITIRHSSPSVANNYALFIQGGDAEVTGCDIRSSTGSGIGLEGGAITVNYSRIHDCVGNGAVIAGSIDSGASFIEADEELMFMQPKDCKASLSGCSVTQNRQASILQKRSTQLQLLDGRGKNVLQPKPELSR